MVKQNPATDPVSAAMSAIESALNLTDDEAPAVLADANGSAPQLAPAKPTAATPVLKPTQLAGRCADAPSRRAFFAVRAGERTQAGDPRGDARE